MCLTDKVQIKKMREKIDKNESILQTKIENIQKIWEDTGLDPNDQSYLVEKTMRFEMAQTEIDKAFALFREIIDQYKKVCKELEKSDES